MKHYNQNYFLLILIIINLTIIFFVSLNRGFNHDEFEHIHGTWKIINGERMYVDFFQHHHGLMYLFLSPIIHLFGESILSIIMSRVFMYFLFILILFITFKICRLYSNLTVSLLSITVLSTCVDFVTSAIEIRPDVPMTVFALLAIWMFLSYEISNKKYQYFLGSFALATSFLFLQKALFLIFTIGLLQLIKLYKKSLKFDLFIKFWMVFIVFLIPLPIYVFSNNIFHEYITFNWLINFHWGNEFSVFGPFIRTYFLNTILWFFFFIGCIKNIFSNKSKDILIICITLILFLFTVKTPFRQYYLIFMPLVSFIASMEIYNYIKIKKYVFYIVILISTIPQILMFVLESGLPGTENLNSFAKYRLLAHPIPNNRYQLEKIDYVLKNTDSDHFVYDGDIQFNVFRKDLDFFWYSVRSKTGGLATLQEIEGYSYDIYSLIEKYKPKIISNYYVNINHSEIKDNYQISDQYDDLLFRIQK